MSINTIPVTSPVDPEAIASLRDQIQGDLYLPDDDTYAEAIRAWAPLTRHTPRIVVMPETASDIARSVAFAHQFNLPVAVQATGHGMPVACDDGILVNTSRMRSVSIDPERQLARVEAGARWQDVIPAAHEHGLAPLSGSATGVGVLGYTLGGGYGWMTRKYGRAADRVIAADLVTATGEMLHVTATSHPDLFWAIRGGSGNFGIVTALEFGLVPVKNVFGGSVMYPLTEASRIFEAYNRWSGQVPDDITSSITVLRLPDLPDMPPPMRGLQAVVIRACGVRDLDAARDAIAPIRDLGSPIMDSFAVLPYTRIGEISADPEEGVPARGAAMMLRDLDEKTIGSLLEAVGPGIESPLVAVEVRDFRRNGVNGDGYGAGTGEGPALFAIGVTMSPEATVAVENALASLRAAMHDHVQERVLLNFLSEGDMGPERTRAAYSPEEFARLREIKRRYDPTNRFRFNHNIAPS